MKALDAMDTQRCETLTREGLQGIVVAGKYELIREIGRGGMGSVWEAMHLQWQAPVAIKLLTISTEIARARFEREARLSAAIRSPHVVQVLDFGVDEDQPFLVMELLEGENLSERIRRLGTLSPAEVMMVVTHVGRALTRAHDAGVVHRDLKPENIYLVHNGDEPLAKLLDFGVARGDASPRPGNTLTAEGRTIGTQWYMSPEQLQGQSLTDTRIDLWALAVIACECLTGQRPFQAPNLQEFAMLLCGASPRPVPSALGSVPAGFDAWFARATAHDVLDRFQSAVELVTALRPVCGGGDVPPVWASTAAPSLTPSVAPLSQTTDAPAATAVPKRWRIYSALVVAILGTAALKYASAPAVQPSPQAQQAAQSALEPQPAPPPAVLVPPVPVAATTQSSPVPQDATTAPAPRVENAPPPPKSEVRKSTQKARRRPPKKSQPATPSLEVIDGQHFWTDL